jgi:hypothetical protein
MVAVRRTELRVESDGYARRRGVGQGRKGAPTREAQHVIDCRLATTELEGAIRMLANPPMEPITRRENRKAAVAKIALGARALDEVLRREDEPLPDTTSANRPASRR